MVLVQGIKDIKKYSTIEIQKLKKFFTYNPLYSSIFLALASLYIKKQNNMQAAVNKRAYFGRTAPILLRPRLLNQYFNKNQ